MLGRSSKAERIVRALDATAEEDRMIEKDTGEEEVSQCFEGGDR
jgi:hypothetical protein